MNAWVWAMVGFGVVCIAFAGAADAISAARTRHLKHRRRALMGSCWTGGHPKRRYPTRAAAKAALKAQRTSQGFDNTGQRPYRCDECGYFHLGHYPTSPAVRAGLREQHRIRAVDGDRGTT